MYKRHAALLFDFGAELFDFLGQLLLLVLVSPGHSGKAVSYTHLDVYKRQGVGGGRKSERRGDDLALQIHGLQRKICV